MPRMWKRYTPLHLSEFGRKQALINHIEACVQEGKISEAEGCLLIDAAMRVMVEDWTNHLTLKRWGN
jgi:hypothetical protein